MRSWTVCGGLVFVLLTFYFAVSHAQTEIDDERGPSSLAAVTQSRTQVSRKPLTRACVLVSLKAFTI
jgi:hypothetical protein